MAIITCKKCGSQSSDSLGKCPVCGTKTRKSTTPFTWLVTIVIVAWVSSTLISHGGTYNTNDQAPTALTEKEEARAGLHFEGKWHKEAYGSILEMDITIKNDSKFDVKDVEISCDDFANSGTRIDSNRRTIYEIFKAGKAKTLRRFNMGFIHSQATSISCSITDFGLKKLGS